MTISSPPQAVAALTESIKNLLESEFCHIVVKGELSNVSLQPSGHLYFGIKDSKSFLNGAFFHFRSKYFDRRPKDGDSVIIHGKLTVYAPRGQYQIVAHAIVYSGEGDLLQKLEETKKRLAAAGYFDPEKKKVLPTSPRTIGVITSPTGAVIQDILRILSRRCRQYKVIIYPVTVQGTTAAQEISRAISMMNEEQLADVLIIARGGGSIEDLWAFNEECIVKAIDASTIPIISAVGHETDTTLCDFAADVRAPTPSAAAEIVCTSSQQQLQTLESFLKNILSHSQQFLSARIQQIQYWKRYLDRADFYRTSQQSLDYLQSSINKEILTKLQGYKQRFSYYQRLLQHDIYSRILARLHDLWKMISQAFVNRLRIAKNARTHIRKNLLVYNTQHLHQRLQSCEQQLLNSIIQRIHFYNSSLKQKYNQLINQTDALQKRHGKYKFDLRLLNKRLSLSIQNITNKHKDDIAHVYNKLLVGTNHLLDKQQLRYVQICEHLFSLNPKNILNRGYAMLFDINNKLAIISARSLHKGGCVKVRLQDGEATLSVIDVHNFES
ncbi:exodeoxyribonuclease VII, large subunit [Chlamydia ibidis]|uniref:Exodeoxyribonuclease 7 large subunit n=2 Tax=Chlamydia ibidis TaxID=1405396 RepID=S7KIZ0_9CHLA|nr:exodeoxyribonuclease VII large subunit [Chlamydia ibidis]EPP34385.1 exodeoxyribonuclease VII, large subunit [Chlamydia ibidis]EQM63130.1 exodeoxyribonuclease VII, large subunit [Chlamydia ibidis 10-1398/6]